MQQFRILKQIFEPISIGETKKAFVKKIREDGRIDIILQKYGVEVVAHSRNDLLSKLEGLDMFAEKEKLELQLQDMRIKRNKFKLELEEMINKINKKNYHE